MRRSQFCNISTLLLSVCTVDKSKMEILQNFAALSEYTNFTPGAQKPAQIVHALKIYWHVQS